MAMVTHMHRRVTFVAGIVILVAAAAVVPLPLRLVAPGHLVEVGHAVRVELDEPFEPGPVDVALSGAYLAVRDRPGATLLAAVAGMVDPRTDVLPAGRARSRATAPGGAPKALTDAALSGLGISPVRAQGWEPMVRVAVADEAEVDSRSLALTLHLFDALANLDVGAGRTIVALGWVDDDGDVHCASRVQPALDAAAAAGAALVIVPAGCQGEAAAPAGLPVATADSFLAALSLITAP